MDEGHRIERLRKEEEEEYAKDAVIKEEFKRTVGIGRNITDEEIKKNMLRNDWPSDISNQSAHLRLDVEHENYLKNPEAYQSKGLNPEYAGNQSIAGSGPLETIEQEKIRLTRQLNHEIEENEYRIRALKQLLNMCEFKQKNMCMLAGSINQSSRVQMDQVHQLRDYLK